MVVCEHVFQVFEGLFLSGAPSPFCIFMSESAKWSRDISQFGDITSTVLDHSYRNERTSDAFLGTEASFIACTLFALGEIPSAEKI